MRAFSKWSRVGALAIIFALGAISTGHAFMFEELSYGTSEQVEINLLNQINQQFIATISSNPFSPNTYSVTLIGMNPNYVAPSQVFFDTQTFENMLDNVVANSTWTYPQGWANGATYNQYQQTNYLATLIAPCIAGSTETFTVAGSTTVYDTQIDTTTCTSVVTTIQNELWQLIDSTSTGLPSGWQ
jgi:hypothetical protein